MNTNFLPHPVDNEIMNRLLELQDTESEVPISYFLQYLNKNKRIVRGSAYACVNLIKRCREVWNDNYPGLSDLKHPRYLYVFGSKDLGYLVPVDPEAQAVIRALDISLPSSLIKLYDHKGT